VNQKKGYYLSGYFNGQRFAYDSLEIAMKECLNKKAPGITYVPNTFEYELRASSNPLQSGTNEISWICIAHNKAQLFSVANKGYYLGGHVNGQRLFYSNLEKAMDKCIELNAGGITYVPSEDVYEIRKANNLSVSPSQEISWVYKPQPQQKSVKELFSEPYKGYYLGGWPNGVRIAYSNLEKAMEKCAQIGAGGVTFVPNSNEYEIRASKIPTGSPSGEISWVYTS